MDVSVQFRVEGEPDDACTESVRLGLADALREALSHDPALQQALARWHRARAASEEARLLPNPVISIGVLLGGPIADAVVDVGLTQDIASFLQRPRRAAASDARLRAAAEESLTAALEVVTSTRTAYLQAQAVDARRASIEQRLVLVTRLLDTHRKSLIEGEGLPGDATALDAERTAIELELLELDGERSRARIELARAIGRPSDAGGWELAPWPTLPEPVGDSTPWLEIALRRRAEVRAILWEVAALTEEHALAGTSRWEGASAGVGAEYDDGLQAGPTLEVPLPFWDPSAPRRAAVEAAVSELKHRAVEVRRGIIRDVRLALAEESAARKALDLIDRGLIPLLERRRREIEEARRAGEAEIAILLLADRELQDARSRRVEQERLVLDARVRLERAAGGPGSAPFPTPGPQGHDSKGDDR